MRRLTASASVLGLGLMSAPGVLFCGSATVGLETRLVMFLSGALLFIAGGSGYAMTTHAEAAPAAASVSAVPADRECRRRVGR
jgi:hypothetical protein